jgi:hypothetical protein
MGMIKAVILVSTSASYFFSSVSEYLSLTKVYSDHRVPKNIKKILILYEN